MYTLWTVSLSPVAAVIFSFVSLSSYAGIIKFFLIPIFLCSVFQFKIFDIRSRWFSLWYSSNLPFSPRLDRYSRWQVFFFQYFSFVLFSNSFLFSRILTPQPFPVFGLTTLWLKNNVACSHRWHAKPTAIKSGYIMYVSYQ